jgi:hypothetical protein
MPAASNVYLLKEKQREAKRGDGRDKKRMHGSHHGGYEPSETLQNSSDFSEAIYKTMACCEESVISSVA